MALLSDRINKLRNAIQSKQMIIFTLTLSEQEKMKALAEKGVLEAELRKVEDRKKERDLAIRNKAESVPLRINRRHTDRSICYVDNHGTNPSPVRMRERSTSAPPQQPSTACSNIIRNDNTSNVIIPMDRSTLASSDVQPIPIAACKTPSPPKRQLGSPIHSSPPMKRPATGHRKSQASLSTAPDSTTRRLIAVTTDVTMLPITPTATMTMPPRLRFQALLTKELDAWERHTRANAEHARIQAQSHREVEVLEKEKRRVMALAEAMMTGCLREAEEARVLFETARAEKEVLQRRLDDYEGST